MNQSQSDQVFSRTALWISIIGLAWAFMQLCHELGHILAAWMTGGTIRLLDLHPFHLSHTLVHPNPQPVVVTWSGPLTGVLLPMFLWLRATRFWKRNAHYLRFFCGFCFIANGAYLGCAAIEAVGDARDLLNNNVPIVLLFTFGVVTIPSGFLLWNGLGPSFGFGSNSSQISSFEVGLISSLLIFTWIIEGICFPMHFAN